MKKAATSGMGPMECDREVSTRTQPNYGNADRGQGQISYYARPAACYRSRGAETGGGAFVGGDGIWVTGYGLHWRLPCSCPTAHTDLSWHGRKGPNRMPHRPAPALRGMASRVSTASMAVMSMKIMTMKVMTSTEPAVSLSNAVPRRPGNGRARCSRVR